jgi:hypothetical protein
MPLALLLWLASASSPFIEPRPLASDLRRGALAQVKDPKPTPEQVRAALQALEEGLASEEPAERVAAIRENAKIDVPGVVAKIAAAVEDRSADVRLEAIDALGRSKQPSALEALLAHYKKHRIDLRKQERVLPRLLTAIARQGDARAIQPLTDDVQAQMLSPTLRARILGLGNVRTKAAVDALVELAGKIGFVEMHNHAEDFRLAMLALTGVDKGRSIDAWRTWWKAEREGFALPEEPPALAPGDATRWNDFWGSRHRPDGR